MPASVKRADIARHWGVSSAYVTITLKRHGGADLQFASLEEADRWRSVHAPQKPARAIRARPLFSGEHEPAPASPAAPSPASASASSTASRPAGSTEKNRDTSSTTNSPSPKATHRTGRVDVASFIEEGGDFDSLMLRQAERVPQIAYGLYVMACEEADCVAIANSTRNWNEAAKAAGGIREKYLELQEKTRALIPLDLVMDIVGTHQQALRVLLLKGGERYGEKANPANPVLGQSVINDFIDSVFLALASSYTRTQKELLHAPEANAPAV